MAKDSQLPTEVYVLETRYVGPGNSATPPGPWRIKRHYTNRHWALEAYHRQKWGYWEHRLMAAETVWRNVV